MPDIVQRLSAVLDMLPVAVCLVAPSGRYLGKIGGVADLLGDALPTPDNGLHSRWVLTDHAGAVLPRSQWPSARALRGERDFAGALGTYHDARGQRSVKVVSMPTRQPDGDVAAVTFVQLLDTKNRSADGSHFDLQQRLINNLVEAAASGWDDFDAMFGRVSVAGTPTPM